MTKDDQSVWEDVVIAILSVNRYSIEKTYANVEGMRTQGLFDPENLTRWSPTEITLRLKNAGYDRGPFMNTLFAQRLAFLGKYIQDLGVPDCQKVLSGDDTKKIEALLVPVKGIGPTVVASFFLLHGVPRGGKGTPPK